MWQIGLPGYASMPAALAAMTRQERATYCNGHWEQEWRKLYTLEFSRCIVGGRGVGWALRGFEGLFSGETGGGQCMLARELGKACSAAACAASVGRAA